MDSPEILAAIEALAPTATEGIGKLLDVLRRWTPDASKRITVHRSSDTIMIAEAGDESRPLLCQFRSFSDAVRFEYMVRGYLASLSAKA